MTSLRVTKVFNPGDKLQRIAKRSAKPVAALKIAGTYVASENRRSFDRQKFGRKQWDKRATPNVFGLLADFAKGRNAPPARRFSNSPALVDTGRLRGSIAWRIAGPRTVEIGSNLDYAALHNFGGETESVPLTKAVQTNLSRWLRGKGKQWASRLGYLTAPSRRGTTLKSKVPARQFIGITAPMQKEILQLAGAAVFEAR